MAYRISYQWSKERELRKRGAFPVKIWAGVLLVAAAVAIRVLVPQSDSLFRALLHPLTDHAFLSALGSLVTDLTNGIGFGEAVTVFCSEIIAHGG